MTAVLLPNRGSLWATLFLALACAGLGLTLAAHHPLSSPLAVLAWLIAAGLAARFWTRTPLLLALLPLIGLAPWSGWITFEELDLLILACAAGGYAAVALRMAPQDRAPAWRQALAYSPLVLLLLGLFALSVLLAVQRGFADAGGFVFGWFQGYHEPMNSLRLGKSFFLAALLLPLWAQAGAVRPRQLSRALLLGMALALAATSLAALWERVAYPGLLNFSSDYRSTALFWEMHVGGAALDGVLALTVPFAVLGLLRARTPLRFGLMMVLLMLAAYACLTTFSRGVYLALPLSLALLVLLRGGQRRRAAGQAGVSMSALMSVPPPAKLGGLLLAGGFVLAAATMFGSSGYRGMLALLGAFMLLLLMPSSLWLLGRGQRLTALLMGAVLAALLSAACLVLSMSVPKSAYISYVLALLVGLGLRWRDKPGVAQPFYACLTAAAWFWLLGCVVIVADYWGGPLARWDAFLSMFGLAFLWPLMLLTPMLWPFKTQGSPGWRNRGLLFGGLLLASSVIAILGGGSYLSGRVSGWQGDLETRRVHWEQGLSMLNTPQEWLLGKGTGRFVANHFFVGPADQHTGDYRLDTQGSRPHLVLTGGKHMLGAGELYRITQRIAPPEGGTRLSVRMRVEKKNVVLRAEVCEKHLLYVAACMVQQKVVASQPGEWQTVDVDFGKAPALGGAWYAPRFVNFSIAIETTGGSADIGELALTDDRGPMLSNGDFSSGLGHWFSSSDRHHMPWHMKNLGLHVLFEQGLLGLALLGTMLLLALWRLSVGRGREHVLAPALAASLVGFVIVGLFDSLVDAPRLGFMFYGLLLFSLGLRALPGSVAEAPK